VFDCGRDFPPPDAYVHLVYDRWADDVARVNNAVLTKA